jgi:hypothetical protein
MPQTPCPLVQPLPSTVPKPTSKPATGSNQPEAIGVAERLSGDAADAGNATETARHDEHRSADQETTD